MRAYNPPPPPPEQVQKFNQYLEEHNEVLDENNDWVLIKNSYEKNRLVLWYKYNARYLIELDDIALIRLRNIIENNYLESKKMWINADKDKSVPQRLHLHFKIK